MRTILVCVTFPVFMFILSGCNDRIEIEKLAHVVVLGLDKGEEDHLVKVTFQIANPQIGSSQRAQTEKEPATDTITITAPDIVSAKELSSSIISRKLNFSHLRTLIISEELARTDMLHRILSSSAGDPELRREINLIISKEKAVDFIKKNRPKLETRPHKYYQFMQERWKDTGYVAYTTTNQYFQRLQGELFLFIYATAEKLNKPTEADEDAYLAGEVPQELGDPVQMMGSAITKYGKMIGVMTGEETRLTLLLRKRDVKHSMVVSFEDPLSKEYRVIARLLKKKGTEVEVSVEKNPPEVQVKVPVYMQVLSIPSLHDYVLNLENQEKLKKAITEQLEKKSKELVEKMQKQFKGEPFLWHLDVRKNFMTLREFDSYEWEKKFVDAKVHVEFDVTIESFGKQFKPPRINK